MSFCGESDQLRCFLVYWFDLLPFMALAVVSIWHLVGEDLERRRQRFQVRRADIVFDRIVLGSKLLFVGFNLSTAVLQLVLSITFHPEESFKSIFSESCFILLWFISPLVLMLDAWYYG